MYRLGLWFVLCTGIAQAQVITTVAGTSYVVPISGVPALKAPLGRADGVAVDGVGNIYVVDSFDQIVARVSTNGILTVVAGNGHAGFSGDGGLATSASLNGPLSVALDSAGNLYIGDTGNNRIREVSQGLITTVAGNGAGGFSGDGGPATGASLLSPRAVAIDSAGVLYIADYFNHRIRKVAGGTITTVAGNGTNGFSGDGGPAISASLNYPQGVAVDSAGNLYIADYYNSRVRKVAGGTITTVAGSGGLDFSGNGGSATSASIAYPECVAVDGSGNLYVSDTSYGVVRKVSSGTITTVAGALLGIGPLGDGGPATGASLTTVTGLAPDSAGNLYIADSYHGRIRKVSGGTITTVGGNGGFSGDGGPAASASLNILGGVVYDSPAGVASDGAGNLYIADADNNRVRRVSSGMITTVAGTGVAGFSGDGGPATSALLNTPVGVAVDAAGSLFIADWGNSRIRKVSGGTITTVAGNGTVGHSGDGGPATSASLANPTGVAVDSGGSFYIADIFNNSIRKVSGGTITTVAGNGTNGFSGDSGPATSAKLSYPTGVAVDAAGNLYIADATNFRIRKVSGGTITTVAGNGTLGFSGDGGLATNAKLFYPVGVMVDLAGNLYIADKGNNRVRRVAQGLITTIAGNGVSGFSGDGGPATSAVLHSPAGLAGDAAGNLYIADSDNNRIREVLAGRPTYQATPMTLSFAAIAGGIATGGQTISLSSGAPGLTYTTSVSASWLSVTPSTGTVPAGLQITADPSTLTPGTYQATIAITVPLAAPVTTSIAVTFTVQPASAAALGIETDLTFSAVQGGATLTQLLRVLNTGGGSLAFTATVETSATWLSVSPAAGTATASSPASLTVTATPSSLALGTYGDSIVIAGAGKTIHVPVTLLVSAPSATILLSQSALSFSAVAQGGMPLPQSFGILNIGQGSMGWRATASTLSGGNWLQISPSSGTVTRPYLDVSLVNVSIDPSTLGAGTYYGQIQVKAAAANTPQVMTVILTVLPPGFTLGAQVFPAGLIFTGVAGVTPGSQDVQVGNPAGQANSFVSGVIGTGLSNLPTNAIVQPNQPTTVHVYPNFSELSPGSIQKGTITLQFSDQSPSQTINVLMVVAPSGMAPGSASPHDLPEASACTSLQIVFRSPQPSLGTITATVGQPVTMDVQVSDGCGNPIGPGGQNGTVTARFSTNESERMTHIGNGVWQGTWRPVSAGAVLMVMDAFTGQDFNTVGAETKPLNVLVSAPAPAAVTPTVTAQGVVNAASIQSGVLAPGGIISVYGQNLADSMGGSVAPFPQQLNGARVFLGDQPLPILFTQPLQLNVQVPYTVPLNTQYQLTVQHGNTLSVGQQLAVAPAQPGIFTMDQSGTGQGAITKTDGTVTRPGNPAAIGDTVVIYCTGLGTVTPKVVEGQPAPSAEPLARTDAMPTVTIGGKAAAVSFSGLTPGYAGLYQVNATVPAGIATGDAVPVGISIAGQTSPLVTMAVR